MAKASIDLTHRVLITQAGTRNGYAITCSLGRMGIPVFCADASRYTHTRFSRYSRGYDTYPSPHREPERYFEAINRIIDRRGVDLVVPAYDEAFFLALHRDRIAKPGALCLPPHSDMMTLHRKVELYRLVERVGGLAPASIALETGDDVERCLETLALPLVLKPERGGGGWAVTIIDNAAQLRASWRAFDRARHLNRLFAQQFIAGTGVGCGAVFAAGRRVAIDTYSILRQHPIGTGTATFRREVACPEAARQVEAVLAALRWNGVAQFDFIIGNDDGRAYLIDGNPRFWGSISHAMAAGADVPFLYYLIATGQSDALPPIAMTPDVTSVWWWGDFSVLCQRLVSETHRWRALGEHLRSWRSTRFDDLHRTDLAPFLFYPIQKMFAGESTGF